MEQPVRHTPGDSPASGTPMHGLKLLAFSVFAGIVAAPFAVVVAGVLGLSQVIAGVAGGVAMAGLVAAIFIRERRRAA